MSKELVEIVRCKNCIHRPIQGPNGVHDIDPPTDYRGHMDYTCPCLNGDDYRYSWYPLDEWFCADGKRKESNMATKDNINPDHYKSSTSLECIEAMEVIFGSEAVIDFCLCNAWKYIWRWKNKNGEEDLDKAEWYVNKALDLLSGSSTIKGYDTTNKATNAVRIADRIHDYITKQKKGENNGKNI